MTCDKCNGVGSLPGYGRCPRCYGTMTPVLGASYAGVGSRSTPLPVVREMENVAMRLGMMGWALRSGAAKPKMHLVGGKLARVDPNTDSADLAFERGADMLKARKTIRTATITQSAMDHAAQYHPNWSACDDHARALHARNSLIMMGDWLDDPVRFVVCWTPGGMVKGGTGQALRIASALNIPVFNLAVTASDDFWRWIAP